MPTISVFSMLGMDLKMHLGKSRSILSLDTKIPLTIVGGICLDFGYATQKMPGKLQTPSSTVGILFIKM